MEIRIDEIHHKIQIDIDPKKYWLVKSDDAFNGKYALAHRIDMSYCGKPDQQGGHVIYLSEKEYQKIKGLVDEIL